MTHAVSGLSPPQLHGSAFLFLLLCCPRCEWLPTVLLLLLAVA